MYSQSNLARDPRVSRQLDLLAEGGFLVSAFGTAPPLHTVDSFHDLGELVDFVRTRHARDILRFLLKRGPLAAWDLFLVHMVCRIRPLMRLRDALERRRVKRRAIEAIKDLDPDLIIANDITALNLCAAAKGRAGLIYDAHEYSPGQEINEARRGPSEIYADEMLKKYLSSCEAMLTVGEGIAGLYEARYGVRPIVMTNSPRYQTLEPRIRGDGFIRLVHHGVASRRRQLEGMIKLMKLLDERFSLDFYLVANDVAYFEELKSIAAGDLRIRFNAPVPTTELPRVLNAFDIGLRFYEPVTINMQHGMPNKFFEYIQARIAVAIGPTPETAGYVKKYGIGVVSKDFTPETMAGLLSALTLEEIIEMKMKAHAHAYELSAEPQLAKLRAIVDALTGGSARIEEVLREIR